MVYILKAAGCNSYSDVFTLVDWGWSKRLVRASRWEGLVPARWWVEWVLSFWAGPCQEVCLSGSCVLRKTLSSLSADEWGCVPTWFFVWPEVSWPASCKVRPGVAEKMMASRKADANEYSLELRWLCFCPCSDPQLPPACVGDPPVLAGRSGPGSYEVTFISLGPGAHKILCVPSKSGSLCFPQTCGIPVIKPCWPSKSDFLGLCLPLQGDPDMGLRTFTPVGEFLWYNSFPVCGSPTGRWLWFDLSWLHPSYYPVVASLFFSVEYLVL